MSVISLVSIISIKNYQVVQRTIVETLFIQQIESKIRATQRLATAYEQDYYFGFEANNFYIRSQATNQNDWQAKLPTHIKSSRENFVIKYLANGNLSKIEKIDFYLETKMERVSYQFLLGSGQYKKTISDN
ncbi:MULTISPECIES: hypothetical protein [unclassified Enterococcus]|uniref:hypothetical protein n=1 Tax=unclassified Enterococcus TaxID=2608891 RepID=UPI001557710E|nr:MULTISPECIES: hypothetical protein [unclassified Enterococcus]MBS7577269.1 hypothetical protein [Enterococcus sp. MMGLQ5-2]MBS7584638.1 hypothetical protein [Enterococcus sp. MMGLQ5-1]NPD12493.1 hypothetical protein [Enterococcus sp. MMGLQ5-1]NPD37103.1 hypothetical protein [Enterococcus sp. MMGLQ5-2]